MTHARFETLLAVDAGLVERQRRMMLSATMAIAVCMGAGMLVWVGDKLGVTAVTPPKNAYAVTFQVLEAPPPPSAPPKLGSTTAREESAADTPAQPAPPEEPPLEDLVQPRPRTKPAAPSGGTASNSGDAKGPVGVPWGAVKGDPRSKCLPPCMGTNPGIGLSPAIHQKKAPAAPALEPWSTTKASGIYMPDPDIKALARTATGLGSRKPGKSTVKFCIDGRGKTYDIGTNRAFGGDPQVDRICRETVKKWRFKPQFVGGKARRTCSKVTFDIRFD